MPVRTKPKSSKVIIRGFMRAVLVDGKTGKICGDSGWLQNKLTNDGLIDLALLLGGQGGSYIVGWGAMATQTAAMDMTQTDMVGRTASFQTLSLSTSGTATLTATVSFSSTMLTASCSVGAAGLYKTNTPGSLICGQTFATSAWNTNQNFNLTYQVRFATA